VATAKQDFRLQDITGENGMTLSKVISKLILGVVAGSFLALPVSYMPANAQTAATGKTGLPIPRFVSIKSGKANMRVGPGSKYQVAWLYKKKGLPMEIIQEFDNWRKVRDPEGNEGWMLHSLLSGKRTAVINPWEQNNKKGMADLKSDDNPAASTRAKIEPGVVANVDYCGEDFCHLTIGKHDGYVSKANVWGVYPDELIEE
jgi:SH3-like domain-containing protein